MTKPKKHTPAISNKEHKDITKRVRAFEKKRGIVTKWRDFRVG